MSVVFLIAPVVVANWPAVCALASSTAAALGYKVGKKMLRRGLTQDEKSVDITLDNAEVTAEQLSEEEEFQLVRGDITISFKRTPEGKILAHVSGKNRTEEELRRIGVEFFNKMKQQYAYNKVVSELKKLNFVVSEEKVEGGKIKITLRRFH